MSSPKNSCTTSFVDYARGGGVMHQQKKREFQEDTYTALIVEKRENARRKHEG